VVAGVSLKQLWYHDAVLSLPAVFFLKGMKNSMMKEDLISMQKKG
jgi:hypothetical protein